MGLKKKNTNISMFLYFRFLFYCRHKANDKRAREIDKWHKKGGALILGYDMFRNLISGKQKEIKANQQATLRRCLLVPGPDLVICDEGHLLKSNNTAISKAVNQIESKRRIVLTGTPLQNNLKECK